MTERSEQGHSRQASEREVIVFTRAQFYEKVWSVPATKVAAEFEYELDAWMRDPDTWPKRRILAMFQQWFEVELAPTVFALSDEPLEL